MNKHESRYFRTAVKMDKALLRLLEKKDFEYITVKELCDEAGVNRSTFYLHYENTVDLLAEAARFVIDGFLDYFRTGEHFQEIQFAECDLRELVFITPQYLTPYLTYVKENRRIFKTVLKHFGVMDFQSVYEKLFRFIFDPILSRFAYPPSQRDYVMRFYLTGITAIVMEWTVRDCRESIEEISQIIIQCTVGNNPIHEIQ